MFSYLSSPRVNLQLFQEAACDDLIKVFDKCEGAKLLVVDENLIGPIDLIVNGSLLRERNIKLMPLNKGNTANRADLPKELRHIIYITRPSVQLMNHIAEQLKRSGSTQQQHHLYFVPRKSCVCLKQLENKEVFAKLTTINELPWNFFALDNDVLSMELPGAFRELNVDGDPTALYQASIGLVQLQKIYGRIPKIYGKGDCAQKVWEHAKQLGSDDRNMFNADKGAIDQLIILDRSIDLMSALATQLTYEGLIDEMYGIQQNKVAMPAETFKADDDVAASSTQIQREPQQKVLRLNSADVLYAELRNKNFNEVGIILSRRAKEMMAERSTADNKSVQDMKQLVDKLPEWLALKRAVAKHTDIAGVILDHVLSHDFTGNLEAEQAFMSCRDIDRPSAFIEDLLARKAELRTVLRLMCLQCVAASGLKEKVLNYYKRELAQVYGIDVLLTISQLEKCGLLKMQTDTRPYAVLRKTLNLTVDEICEVEPTDISYVHSGYAPLTVRIVEQTLKPLGWQSLKSQINILSGQSFEDFQAQLIGIGGRQSSATPNEGSSLNIPRVVLIFIVGGCTFAEIAALRFVAQQEDNNVEFVIATTKLINKNSFLDQLM